MVSSGMIEVQSLKKSAHQTENHMTLISDLQPDLITWLHWLLTFESELKDYTLL